MEFFMIVFVVGIFGITLIYQAAYGFPLYQNYRSKKIQKRNDEIARIKRENQEKIKLLDKKLRGEGDIELYISLNKYNLPHDEGWEVLLPRMMKELLAIGWTTDMTIYTKYAYWHCDVSFSIPDKDLSEKAYEILHKYLDEYDDMWDESNQPSEYKRNVKTFLRKNQK